MAKANSPARATETIKLPPPGTGQGELRAYGGSASDDFNNILVGQTTGTLWMGQSPNAEGRQQKICAAAAALVGIKPADELEGMLAAQLVATHAAALECYRRAMLPDQPFEGWRESLNQANKLVRSYAVLVETLDRHRGKGQQRVTVEHVHVHQGGQAIVGAVTQGGGAAARLEDQPHAPRTLTHEPGAPLWSADPLRDAVPIAGDTP